MVMSSLELRALKLQSGVFPQHYASTLFGASLKEGKTKETLYESTCSVSSGSSVFPSLINPGKNINYLVQMKWLNGACYKAS